MCAVAAPTVINLLPGRQDGMSGCVFFLLPFFTRRCNVCHIQKGEMEGGMWEAPGTYLTLESTKNAPSEIGQTSEVVQNKT